MSRIDRRPSQSPKANRPKPEPRTPPQSYAGKPNPYPDLLTADLFEAGPLRGTSLDVKPNSKPVDPRY